MKTRGNLRQVDERFKKEMKNRSKKGKEKEFKFVKSALEREGRSNLPMKFWASLVLNLLTVLFNSGASLIAVLEPFCLDCKFLPGIFS